MHVHAHYQLVLGDDITKNFWLPSSAVPGVLDPGGLFLPAPEFELAVLVLRLVLKHATWDAMLQMRGALAASERRELAWLEAATDWDAVQGVVREHLPFVMDVWPLCRRAVEPGCRATVRASLALTHALQRLCAAGAARARSTLRLVRRVTWGGKRYLLRKPTRKRLVAGGAVVALVGGDGAGKSTAVEGVSSWLSRAFVVERVHLGRPPQSLTTLTVKGALVTGHEVGLFPELAEPTTPPDDLTRPPSTAWLTWHTLTARDRYRLYARARRVAANGGMVVCDRFPLTELRSMDGARTTWAEGMPGLSRLVSRLVRLEARYTPPSAGPTSWPSSVSTRRSRSCASTTRRSTTCAVGPPRCGRPRGSHRRWWWTRDSPSRPSSPTCAERCGSGYDWRRRRAGRPRRSRQDDGRKGPRQVPPRRATRVAAGTPATARSVVDPSRCCWRPARSPLRGGGGRGGAAQRRLSGRLAARRDAVVGEPCCFDHGPMCVPARDARRRTAQALRHPVFGPWWWRTATPGAGCWTGRGAGRARRRADAANSRPSQGSSSQGRVEASARSILWAERASYDLVLADLSRRGPPILGIDTGELGGRGNIDGPELARRPRRPGTRDARGGGSDPTDRKSTISRDLYERLSSEMDSKHLYFGSGDGPSSLLRRPMKAVKDRFLGSKESARGSIGDGAGGGPRGSGYRRRGSCGRSPWPRRSDASSESPCFARDDAARSSSCDVIRRCSSLGRTTVRSCGGGAGSRSRLLRRIASWEARLYELAAPLAPPISSSPPGRGHRHDELAQARARPGLSRRAHRAHPFAPIQRLGGDRDRCPSPYAVVLSEAVAAVRTRRHRSAIARRGGDPHARGRHRRRQVRRKHLAGGLVPRGTRRPVGCLTHCQLLAQQTGATGDPLRGARLWRRPGGTSARGTPNPPPPRPTSSSTKRASPGSGRRGRRVRPVRGAQHPGHPAPPRGRRGTPLQRFVYASSSSVYGDAPSYPTSTRTTAPFPQSPYGVTKLAASTCAASTRDTGACRRSSLRYFTVYGPRQRPTWRYAPSHRGGTGWRPFPLYGDGRQIRDFTYVDDVVRANQFAAGADVAPGLGAEYRGRHRRLRWPRSSRSSVS